jgi:hypothetical protein
MGLFNFLRNAYDLAFLDAINSGDLEAAKSALQDGRIFSGVNINAKDLEGRTALHKVVVGTAIGTETSVDKITLDKIKFLIENKADINAQDDHGNNALHLAAPAHKLDLIKFLIDNNVDINHKNQDGKTPADLIASWLIERSDMPSGASEMFEFLIKKGAIIVSNDMIDRTLKKGGLPYTDGKEWKAVLKVLGENAKDVTPEQKASLQELGVLPSEESKEVKVKVETEEKAETKEEVVPQTQEQKSEVQVQELEVEAVQDIVVPASELKYADDTSDFYLIPENTLVADKGVDQVAYGF